MLCWAGGSDGNETGVEVKVAKESLAIETEQRKSVGWVLTSEVASCEVLSALVPSVRDLFGGFNPLGKKRRTSLVWIWEGSRSARGQD